VTRLRRFLAEAWLRLAELIGLEPETVFDTATNPPAPPERAFKPCLRPCVYCESRLGYQGRQLVNEVEAYLASHGSDQ
jgi:hypothetical protein